MEQNHLSTHKASFRYESFPDSVPNKAPSFHGKRAILAISVGQLYHEGGKFLATINLLNKHQFERCDIAVADTLQRYNYYGNMSESEALIYSKKAGDEWIKRNAFALSRCNFQYDILRWDTFLSWDKYPKMKSRIEEAYHNDNIYKLALHTNVETYLDRLKQLNPLSNESKLFSFGLQYLIEECPIVMPLWAELGYDFIVYPKPLTVGMAKTRELFVQNSKCQWIHLRFKKRRMIVCQDSI